MASPIPLHIARPTAIREKPVGCRRAMLGGSRRSIRGNIYIIVKIESEHVFIMILTGLYQDNPKLYCAQIFFWV